MARILEICALALVLSACDGANEAKRSKPENVEILAFQMGRLYQSACLWNLLEQPEEAESAMKLAFTAARALNVTLPETPDWSGMPTATEAGSIAASIEAGHGCKAASSFTLAFLVQYAMYNAAVGNDTKVVVERIWTAAVESELPRDLWKPRLETIAREPSAENYSALFSDLQRHYCVRPT